MKKFRTFHPIWTLGMLLMLLPWVALWQLPLPASPGLVIGIGSVMFLVGLVVGWVGFLGTYVAIEPEGIDVHGLREKHFIPFDDLAHLRPFTEGSGEFQTEGIMIALTRGREVKIPCQNGPSLIAAIREGQRQYVDAEEGLETAGIDPQTLARCGRQPRRWLDEIRALTKAQLGYRWAKKLVVDPADLWALVENRSADTEQRAGAAMALTPLEGRSDRARLLVVAQATSDERLRVALSTAAARDPSDEELAEALAEVTEQVDQR